MNIYYERLEEFWLSKGCDNANAFAKLLGLSRSENINRLDRDDSAKPGFDLVEKIVLKFNDFDVYYLFTGKRTYGMNNSVDLAEAPLPPYKDCPNCDNYRKQIALLEELRNVYKKQADECCGEKEHPPEKYDGGGVEKGHKKAG